MKSNGHGYVPNKFGLKHAVLSIVFGVLMFLALRYFHFPYAQIWWIVAIVAAMLVPVLDWVERGV